VGFSFAWFLHRPDVCQEVVGQSIRLIPTYGRREEECGVVRYRTKGVFKALHKE
jgi:hypothetical protein